MPKLLFSHLFALVICACFAGATAAEARSAAEIAAVFDAGVAAYDAGDYEKAFKIWWELRYEDLAAMRNLGMMLRKGQGTEKAPAKAEEIYQRAAEAGLAPAGAGLGERDLQGEGGAPRLGAALPPAEGGGAGNHP